MSTCGATDHGKPCKTCPLGAPSKSRPPHATSYWGAENNHHLWFSFLTLLTLPLREHGCIRLKSWMQGAATLFQKIFPDCITGLRNGRTGCRLSPRESRSWAWAASPEFWEMLESGDVIRMVGAWQADPQQCRWRIWRDPLPCWPRIISSAGGLVMLRLRLHLGVRVAAVESTKSTDSLLLYDYWLVGKCSHGSASLLS